MNSESIEGLLPLLQIPNLSEGDHVLMEKIQDDGSLRVSRTLTGELTSFRDNEDGGVHVGRSIYVYSDDMSKRIGAQELRENYSPSHSSAVAAITPNGDGTYTVATSGPSRYRLTIREKEPKDANPEAITEQATTLLQRLRNLFRLRD